MEEKESFFEILKKYRHNPEIAKALNQIEQYKLETDSLRDDLIIENVKLMQKSEKDKKRIAYFRHEIINAIGANKGLTELLINYYDQYNDCERKDMLDSIFKSGEKIDNLSGFLHSKENIPKTTFSLETIALNDANIFEKDIMNNEKIGLNVRYRIKYGKPIEIYSNITDFEALFGTMLTNSISWTPEYSRIEEAFRIDKGNNLEILFENKKSEERLREKGMGKGYGFQMIKEIIEDLGGEFHNYSKSQIIPNAHQNYYDEMKKFGNKKATDNIQVGDEIFGTMIKIPMKNISKQ